VDTLGLVYAPFSLVISDVCASREAAGAAAGWFLLQRGEERLADGVVERAALGAHRDRDPGIARRLAEDQRHILAAPVAVVCQSAISKASTTSSERMCSAIAQPTQRRLKQSMTTAR
jgi:hypothetical protein